MTHAPALHVLLLSSRPAASPFFEGLARRHAPPAAWPFAVTQLPGDPDALARHAREVEAAAVALVDVYPTPEATLRVCLALRTRRPALPVLALLCCSRTACPEELRALRVAGAGLSGAHATPEQLLADIQSVARGEDVLDVRPAPQPRAAPALLDGRGAPSAEAASSPALTAENVQLLALVAEGHTDQEIAQGLHVSLRTAQTRIERLCQVGRARNRTHLAAWAVQQGLVRLAPADGEPPPSRPEATSHLGAWDAPRPR